MIKKLSVLLFILNFIILGSNGCKSNEDINKRNDDNIISSDFGEIRIASTPEKIPEASKSRNDTLVVDINAPNGKFNPIYSNSIYDTWVCNLIFDGLISHNTKGTPIGNVAESWNISEDGKTYTFKLRDNIKFSDGTDLTAQDVKFTYTALCELEYSGAYGVSFKLLEGYEEYAKGNATEVSGIKVINDNEISFIFKEIKSSVIHDFSIGILSKKYYNFKKGNIKSLNKKLLKPIGSGPYILTSFKIGEEVVLTKNNNYWNETPKIENIIMKVSDDNSSIDSLINGDVDIARIAATPQNVNVIKKAGFLDMHLYDDNGFQYIGLNLRKDKFKDKKVRQALIYGLNRNKFIEDYYGEYGEVFNVPFSKTSWAYPNKTYNQYNYDKEKASNLLADSGWILREDGYRYNSEGKKFIINWITYEGNIYVSKLISRVKGDWNSLGIEVIEEILPFETLVQRVFESQDFDMYNMAWNLGIDPDPSPMFALSEDVPGGYNAVGWRSIEGEKLIQTALRELDISKRKIIYDNWAKLANEELPYIYLNQNKELYAVNCRIKNLELSPYTDWTTNIHKLFIQSK